MSTVCMHDIKGKHVLQALPCDTQQDDHGVGRESAEASETPQSWPASPSRIDCDSWTELTLRLVASGSVTVG